MKKRTPLWDTFYVLGRTSLCQFDCVMIERLHDYIQAEVLNLTLTNNLFAGPNTFFFIVRCIGCYVNFFSIPDMKTAGAFCSDRAVIRQRIKENRIVRNQNGRAVLNRDRLITLKIIILHPYL